MNECALETLDRVAWKNKMDKRPRFASKKIYEKLDDSFLDGILIRHQTCPEDEGHNQIG